MKLPNTSFVRNKLFEPLCLKKSPPSIKANFRCSWPTSGSLPRGRNPVHCNTVQYLNLEKSNVALTDYNTKPSLLGFFSQILVILDHILCKSMGLLKLVAGQLVSHVGQRCLPATHLKTYWGSKLLC